MNQPSDSTALSSQPSNYESAWQTLRSRKIDSTYVDRTSSFHESGFLWGLLEGYLGCPMTSLAV